MHDVLEKMRISDVRYISIHLDTSRYISIYLDTSRYISIYLDISRYISILCISWSNLVCWAPTLFYDVLMLEDRGLTFCSLLLVKGPSDQVQAPSGEPTQTDLTILQNLAESCTASDRFWQRLLSAQGFSGFRQWLLKQFDLAWTCRLFAY